MKSSWTNGLPVDEAIEVRRDFKAGALLRSRLCDLLESKVQSAHREGRSKDLYDTPNWAYRQADIQGYTRAMHDVISLITEGKEKV